MGNDIFKELNNVEKMERLNSLSEQKVPIQLWTKGALYRDVFDVSSFDSTKNILYLTSKHKSEVMIDSEVFVRFELNNLQYFTTTTLKHVSQNRNFSISVQGKIFKCEKRKNFRLPQEALENFTCLIEDISYEGHDLSVGGLSIILPPVNISGLQVGRIIENCQIHFNGHSMAIPFCKIVHHRQKSDDSLILVGIEFNNLPDKLEFKMFRIMNTILYEYIAGKKVPTF